jgi:hypothetical protein
MPGAQVWRIDALEKVLKESRWFLEKTEPEDAARGETAT